jgi:hypothetical protein
LKGSFSALEYHALKRYAREVFKFAIKVMRKIAIAS